MANDFPDPNPVGNTIMAGNTPVQFTGHLLNRRRLQRAAKNPMDVCTIVSIFPVRIEEIKHTIEPGHFVIESGTYENPAILHVGSSSWWKDYDLDQPQLEIPTGSVQVAESVINDYSNGIIGCDMGGARPGLFFVLGRHSITDIKMKYKQSLDEANARQMNWYQILIKQADALWATSNGNPLVIAEEMKLAAHALNLTDRPWLRSFQQFKMESCKYCGSLRDPRFPICPSCKAIDHSHPLAKDIKFAAQG